MDDERGTGGIPGWLWSAALALMVLAVTAFLLHRR